MKNRRAILIAIALIVLVIVGVLRRPEESPGAGPEEAGGDPAAGPAGPRTPSEGPSPDAPSGPRGPIADTIAGRKPYDTGIKDDPRVRHTPDGKHIFVEATSMAGQLHDPESSPEQDLSHLHDILAFYRMAFRENPVAGDNQSVMAALMGQNPRDIVLFPADHPSLNEEGELLDRWGSPYYFHALSGTVMEIVSLGPDQKLGTDDDLIFTPRDERDFFRGVTEKPDYGIEEEE